jgi:hypothetical protein
MKSMSPTEYEVLFALFKLKKKGVNSAGFKHICGEVNVARKQNKQKALSFQLVYYYLSRLVKQPFVKRKNSQRLAKYELKHGLWKLNQSPPLCVFINNEVQMLLPCPEVTNCKKRKPDTNCPPIKLMREMVKTTIPTVSSKNF